MKWFSRIILLLLLLLGLYFRETIGTYFGFTTSTQSSYTLLLEQALSRNSAKKGTGSVIFSQADMQSGKYDGTRDDTNGNKSSYFPESEFNRKQNELGKENRSGESNLKTPTLPSANFGELGGNSVKRNIGNVALNNTSISGGLGSGNDGVCRGLIFDPCIVLEAPDIDSDGPMFLGKTPIYRYSQEVPEMIF